ncbi:cell adhesion molecule DSCAM-like isoform X2 [Ptychodera flava]|uniref:cell adhesion molecule DSCAM-like isoform X2 n=1 Tax=Ptychodera flava TaxID=63121 RepID=UPI00396A1893
MAHPWQSTAVTAVYTRKAAWLWTLLLLSWTECLTFTQAQDVTGISHQPANLFYACPNLNCSVSWEHPIGASNDSCVYFTEYQEFAVLIRHPNEWIPKPECSNTTVTSCNFGADFSSVIGTWVVRIRTLVEGQADLSAPSEVSINPYFEATLGPPNITSVDTTSRTIHIRWDSPLTPFYSGSVQLRMRDFYPIDYNMTHGQVSGHTDTDRLSQNLNGMEYVFLDSKNGIVPWSTYEISLQGQINMEYGISVKLTVTTDEEVPRRGVNVYEEEQSHDCSVSTNARNVSLAWTAPEREHWYGLLTKYVVRYWCSDNNDNVTEINIGINTMSVVLHNVSRWCEYGVEVHICNSAGCTRNENQFHIAAHELEMHQLKSTATQNQQQPFQYLGDVLRTTNVLTAIL